MKPAQERNQESLPPKKRDLPHSNSAAAGGTGGGGAAAGAGGASGGGNGEAEAVSAQNSAAGGDAQGGNASGEWARVHPEHRYGADRSESVSAGPVDQYSMIYKVAVPSVTYSSASLHPVLSHISPAYTVHSPLLQHPGLSYPPLGYAHIPHPSLQFVSSPYAAVPYAVPSGFVPGSLISPSGAIPQHHAVPHLVPYPSVMQDGVVSPPPQAQAHAFTKVAAPSGVPLMMPSEQAAQQHMGAIGVLPAPELGSRGLPVFYQPQGSRGASAAGDCHNPQQGSEAEVNGGDKEQGVREVLRDSAYASRNAHVQQVACGSAAQEHSHERVLQNRRLEGRSSPGQRSTPDSDLEVQQVVGRLAASCQGGGGGVRKEVPFAPLNLSQGVQRSRDVHGESAAASGRAPHAAPPFSYGEHKAPGVQQQTGQPGHAVMLTNGQPVLVPLDYHPQQHYPGQAHEAAASRANASFKTSDSSGRAGLPERAEAAAVAKQQHQQPSLQPSAHSTAELTQASGVAPAPAASNPSHFMKGAIIQLATGELKRVEDLQTQDFVRSAEVSGGLKIDSSMVMDIRPSQQRPGLVSLHFTVGEQQSKVTIDVPPEHPFFVFGQGWSSCSPERTAQLYGLTCHHLQVGDMCVSITLQQQQQPPPPQLQKQPQHHNAAPQNPSRTSGKSNAASGPDHQLMGPPAPQLSRPQAHPRMERLHRERHRDGDRDAAEKDEAHLAAVGHTESPARRGRTPAEHPRSQSSYHLHTEGSAYAMQNALSASQRRWSSPGLQRYGAKGEEGPRPQVIATRPSFIPQEVKLSIEGRSNAGK